MSGDLALAGCWYVEQWRALSTLF